MKTQYILAISDPSGILNRSTARIVTIRRDREYLFWNYIEHEIDHYVLLPQPRRFLLREKCQRQKCQQQNFQRNYWMQPFPHHLEMPNREH